MSADEAVHHYVELFDKGSAKSVKEQDRHIMEQKKKSTWFEDFETSVVGKVIYYV